MKGTGGLKPALRPPWRRRVETRPTPALALGGLKPALRAPWHLRVETRPTPLSGFSDAYQRYWVTAVRRAERHDGFMPNYRRVLVPGGTYFFTVNLQQRDRSLLVEHIEHLRGAFRVARAGRPFEIVAAVVLSDHLHCVWRLPEGDADYATRWRHIKSLFSRSLVVTGSASRRANRCERGIWQRRFWEHCIRDERDLLRISTMFTSTR